jgi:hypothetical protein
MATETVSRNDRHAFLNAARAAGTDIEDCLVLGKAFTALAQWIECARRIIEEADASRRAFPDLDQALKAHDICTGLDWEDEVSSGLVYLMQEIEGRFSALHKAHFPELSEAAA